MFGCYAIIRSLMVSVDVDTSHCYHTPANTAALLRYILQMVAMSSVSLSLQFPTAILEHFLHPCLLA